MKKMWVMTRVPWRRLRCQQLVGSGAHPRAQPWGSGAPDPGSQESRICLSPQRPGSPKVVSMSATPEERLAQENRRLRQQIEALQSQAQAWQSEKQAFQTQVQELESIRRNLEHTV